MENVKIKTNDELLKEFERLNREIEKEFDSVVKSQEELMMLINLFDEVVSGEFLLTL